MVSKSKVRSIHSSLSIEANSLSLFDVENILQNKQIFGKRDEVQEVKNAIRVYNHINNYNYKSEDNFLKVKQIMTKYFDEDNGGYRNHGDGVKRKNKIIELIANDKSITQNEIANIIGANVRTIKRHFKVLIDNNIIERVGSDKKGYWEILK